MLPGVKNNTKDGNLGLGRDAPDKMLVVGPCSGGVLNTITTASQANSLSDSLGIGRAVTIAGHILDVAGGSVDVCKCAASVAASNSAVTASGSGPTVAVSGTALEAFDAIVRIDVSGQLGAGRFSFSLDGGETYGPLPRTLPTGGSFVIPNSGLTLTFSPISGVTRSGGTAGPAVTFTGATPAGDYDIIVEITTGGTVGTAVFKWSKDGGSTYTTGVTTSATVVLGTTGITANFAAGTYVLGEKYAASSGYNAGETYSFTATPATFNSADLDPVITALKAANTRWKAIVWAARPASASAAAILAATIGGHMATLAAQTRDSKGLIDAGADTVPNVQTAFDAVGDLRLAAFYEQANTRIANPIEGWRNPKLPTLVRGAASVAVLSRGSNIGWVGLGAAEGPGRPSGGRLSKVSAIVFDEGKAGEQLHDHRIITTRTFDGDAAGRFYFTNGLLLSPIGSDFRYLHWGLAFDLLCQTVADALKPYVNASVPVLADGTGVIDPTFAAFIDKAVNAAIREAVLTPITEQGKGYFSAAQYATDLTYNVLKNKKLVGAYKAVPLANTEQVELTGGLSTDLFAVQVAA